MTTSATPAHLTRLLEPQSVAIVGASSRQDSIPGRVLETLRGNAFGGPIYPVNPNRASVGGLPAYASLSALPVVPELAIVVTPASAAVDAVLEAGRLGIPFAIVLSSGFNETVDGTQLARVLLDAQEESGIRILGPNCQGFVDFTTKVAVGFNARIDPARRRAPLRTGEVVVLSQSSGLGFALADRVSEAGVGIRAVVTTGNEIDLEIADFVDHYAETGAMGPLLVFVEALRAPRRFVQAVQRARDRGIDVVGIKAGSSEPGLQAAQSHTGKLTGDGNVHAAVFAKAGVISVESADDAVEAVRALSISPLRAGGKRFGIVTASGGGGVWVTDHLVRAGLRVPTFSSELQKQLADILTNGFAAVANPVDVTAQSSYDDSLTNVLAMLDKSDETDGTVLVGNFGYSDWIAERAELRNALLERAKPVIAFSYSEPSDVARQFFEKMRVACVIDPRRAAAVASVLVRASVPREQPHTKRISRPVAAAEVKNLLETAGVHFNPERRVSTVDEAVQAAENLGYPIVLKIGADDATHKSDGGGVVLGIKDERDVRIHFPALLRRSRELDKGTVAVQHQLHGHEILVGAINHASAGCIVVVGAGGHQVELREQRLYLLAPASTEEIEHAVEALSDSRAWREGYRDLPPSSVDALVAFIKAFSEITATLNSRSWRSLECNPVILNGSHVCAVDYRYIEA